MTKSDLLDKIKTLLIRMQDHETPDNVTSKEELGPLLRDAEDLIETVSILKYLIEEEDVQKEDVAPIPEPPEVLEEVQEEVTPPSQEIKEENTDPVQEEEVVKPETVESPTEEEVLTTQPITENQATLNESIAPTQENGSVGDKLENEVVNDLQSAIGLNERFLFVSELFDGDGDAYQNAIGQLNSFNHLQEAMQYLRAEVSDKYNWDQEQESTISFYALIEKRYAE